MIFRKSLWNSISQKTREGATKTHKFQHKGHLLPKGSWAAPDDTRKILILYTKFILGGQNPRKGPRRGNHPPREALLGEKAKTGRNFRSWIWLPWNGPRVRPPWSISDTRNISIEVPRSSESDGAKNFRVAISSERPRDF